MNNNFSIQIIVLAICVLCITRSNAQVQKLILPQGHDYIVMNVDVDTKGMNLLSGGKEGEGYIWDLRSTLPYYKITGHRWDIMFVQFVNDSVFVTGGEEGKLLIHNVNQPWDTKSIELPERAVVMTADIDPSRKFIACIIFDNSGDNDLYSLLVADLSNQDILYMRGIESDLLTGGESFPMFTDMKFSPDGKNIVSTQGSHLFHWRSLDAYHKFEFRGADIENKKRSVNFYKPGVALTINSAGIPQLYNLDEEETSTLKMTDSPAGIMFENYHPESGYLVQLFSDSIRLYNVKTQKEIYRISTGQHNTIGFKSVPALKLFITYDMDGKIRTWNFLTGLPIAEYKPHSGDVGMLSLSKNENLLISGNQDSKVRFWDLKNMELRNVFTAGRYDGSLGTGHIHGIIGMSHDEASGLMACTSDNISLQIINYKTGTLVDSFQFSDVPNHVQLLPSKDLLFVNGYSTVDIYQLSTHKKLKEFGKKLYWNSNSMQYLPESPISHFSVDLEENTIYISNADGNYSLLGLSLQTLDTTMYIAGAHTREITAIKKIPSKKLILSTGKDGAIHLWNSKGSTEVPIATLHVNAMVESIEYHPGKNKIYAITDANKLLEISIKNNSLFLTDSAELRKGISLVLSAERDQLFVGSGENTISIWNLSPLQHTGNLIYIDSADYIFLDTFNNYKASKPALSRVGIKEQKNILSMMQFDVKYNRPDKVLEALGNTDSSLINSYRKAYEKRIKKLGIDTTAFRDGYSVPEADFENRDTLEYEMKNENLTLRIKGIDNTYKLDRFNIWVNEAPVYGQRGISLRNKHSNNFDSSITIKLSQGENRIETSVSNVNGTESYRIPLIVNYTPTIKQKEKTYFIGIGIDQFADSKYNLQYSAKDIRDLSNKLKEKYKEDIIIDTLFNENVTLSNVKALKKKLLLTSENDKVMIAYSGHGMLSKDYDYYLSTYAVNFENPVPDGLPYDELESLLDSIPARKKLLLIDACHSGEVDKEELEKLKTNMATVASEIKGAKGVTPLFTAGSKKLGMKNSFELMQELFVNVGKSTGATVISAAAGTQFALERGDLKNGVFTYSILEFMKDHPTATLSQLKEYVNKRVPELTKGLQVPTSRTETTTVNWNVW